jgi:hypothetical protein
MKLSQGGPRRSDRRRHIFKRDAARRSWNVSAAALCALRPRCDLNRTRMAKTERACTMLIQFFFSMMRLEESEIRTCWKMSNAAPRRSGRDVCVFTCSRLIGEFGRWRAGDFEVICFYAGDVIVGINTLLSFYFFCQCVTFKAEVDEWQNFMEVALTHSAPGSKAFKWSGR